LAFVPESPALYEQFTPLEILRMGLSMYGIKRKDVDAWCMHWLERFSVDMNAKRRIRELSKGNVQRVALAHAMVVQPKLLVLDEPLSGLDPVGRKDVVDILTEFKQQGGAIFFTSHVLHDVERIADRFGFINKGELLTVRSPRELAAERADDMLVRYHAAQPIGEPLRVLREGEFECEVLQADLPAFIAQLNQLGGHLLTVKPAVSLETVFFNILDAPPERQQPDVGCAVRTDPVAFLLYSPICRSSASGRMLCRSGGLRCGHGSPRGAAPTGCGSRCRRWPEHAFARSVGAPPRGRMFWSFRGLRCGHDSPRARLLQRRRGQGLVSCRCLQCQPHRQIDGLHILGQRP